ncbi:cytochrome P450 [Aspergillus parasiticus]|uniref:Cytochrome P450 n=2 Tax=Aspergillus subgen. Circumdati TaxID=2720871 RepID=A0A5N6DFC3_ASPPA|nr:cytochrome P450 [Aspergillus parasiticus]KAE8313578.1 cytochrome P450 [Aspergillus transmontanensis]
MPSPIPKPKGVPILGNLFDLDGKNTWGSFNKLAKDYRPIFKINILGKDIVFITGAHLLEEVCDETRFRKCVAGPILAIRDAVNDSLFTAKHTEEEMISWGVAHRIMAPLVSWEAVEQVFSGIQETTDDLIKKWTAGSRQRINVTNDLDRCNHAANMLCFFDQRVHIMEGPEPAVIKAMDCATNEAMHRPLRLRIVNWLFYNRKWNAWIKTMRDYGTDIVATRRANPTDKKDMLYALLEGKDPETGKGLTESQVLDEIINIFIGSATAPNLIAFAMYYLANNPDAAAKAREELDAVVGGPSVRIEHEHLARLPYTEGVLRESFRLSGVAPGFNIEPLPETEGPVLLAGGEYEVPKDQALIAILAAVNRDPAVFEDPEAFKPERMVGENFDRLPKGVKKGFGNGKRECIGKRYAWQWSFMVLASILKDVEFELADPNYKVGNDGVNCNGAFSVRPQEMFVVTGPRARAA